MRARQTIGKARRHRNTQRKIRGGLVEAYTARNLDVDVRSADRELYTLFEDGKEKLDTLHIHRVSRPARRLIRRRRNKSLYLDEQGPRPLHRRHDDGSTFLGTFGEKEL